VAGSSLWSLLSFGSDMFSRAIAGERPSLSRLSDSMSYASFCACLLLLVSFYVSFLVFCYCCRAR
jgi:hypothetical protein